LTRLRQLLLLLPLAATAQVTFTASPTSLAFSYANGGAAPAAQFIDVALQPAGAPRDLFLLPSTESFNWLRVALPNGSTGGHISSTERLRVTVDPFGMPNGTHHGSIRIVAHQSGTSLSVTVAVTLTISGAGGASPNPTVLFTPRELRFVIPQNGSSPDLPLDIDTSVSARIPFTLSASAPWITLLANSGTTPGRVSVRAQTNGLAPGDYQGLILLSAAGIANPGATVPVMLTIMATSPSLAVSPERLNFTSMEGGPLPAGQVLSITSPTDAAFDVTVTDPSWLAVSRTNGVTPATVTVSLRDVNFSPGTFSGFVRVSFFNNSLVVPVTWVIERNPRHLRFSSQDFLINWQKGEAYPPPVPFAFTTLDGSVTTYTAGTATPWLQVTPRNGVSPAPVTLSLAPAAAELAPGTYLGQVELFTPGGAPRSLPVQLKVSDKPFPIVSTATFNFSAAAGTGSGIAAVIPPVQRRSITALHGTLPLTVGTLYATGSGWYEVWLSANTTPAELNVRVRPGTLPAGSYSLAVRVSSGANSVDIPLMFTISQGSRIVAAPAALEFSSANQFAPQSIEIGSTRTNFNYSVTPAIYGSSARWLTVNSSGGFTPGRMTVAVNPALVNPGTHTGSIFLLALNAEHPLIEIPVTLKVNPRTLLRVMPLSLDFTLQQGRTPPAPRRVDVESGEPVPYRLAATVTSPSANQWLSLSATQGVTNSSFEVRIAPSAASLAPGTYTGTVTITGPESSNATTLEVRLTVTDVPPPAPPGTPVITAVVNAANYRPEEVSPGMLVTILGENLGPTPAVAGEVVAGRFTPSAGGRWVYFDGIAAPILYSSAKQINAIVPYVLAGRAATRMWVQWGSLFSAPATLRVVPTAPGIFTVDGHQAAALNEDGSVNSPANRAKGGSIVVLFVTGEGAVAPDAADGEIVEANLLRRPVAPIRVHLDGVEIPAADILYAGSAPGLVSGLMQVNFRLPLVLPDKAALPVEITAGSARSPTATTIAVR
jgi:uncharacterized protein (TIGR03437 family)